MKLGRNCTGLPVEDVKRGEVNRSVGSIKSTGKKLLPVFLVLLQGRCKENKKGLGENP